MPIGQGKYDPQLSEALRACGATQGLLIVIDGKEGSSFCAQLDVAHMIRLPHVLRDVAAQIEEQHKKGEV